jgi:lipopolysaccharide heptosyltransferase II
MDMRDVSRFTALGRGGPAPDPARVQLWRRAQDILVIRLDNLGDVLMTSPAIRAIRQTNPLARLTLLASPAGAAAAAHLPEIHDVIEFEAPWMRAKASDTPPSAAAGLQGAAERYLIQQLSLRRFDAAIIFTVCTQSALPAAVLCYLAGIPLRLAHSRENPYRLLTDVVRDPELAPGSAPALHEVERQLALVGQVGYSAVDDRLVFEILPIERAGAERKLMRAGIDLARPFVVIHPGASAPSRRWPAEDFGRAADLLAHDHQIVFVGGAGEADLVRQARQVMKQPAAELIDTLSLGELGAVIDRATLLLCNNSAPAHIAAALDTPVVVLYALTNLQHKPWRVPARVLYRDVPCRNCLKSTCPQAHHSCLMGVRPPRVAEAARELLRCADELRADPELQRRAAAPVATSGRRARVLLHAQGS